MSWYKRLRKYNSKYNSNNSNNTIKMVRGEDRAECIVQFCCELCNEQFSISLALPSSLCLSFPIYLMMLYLFVLQTTHFSQLLPISQVLLSYKIRCGVFFCFHNSHQRVKVGFDWWIPNKQHHIEWKFIYCYVRSSVLCQSKAHAK